MSACYDIPGEDAYTDKIFSWMWGVLPPNAKTMKTDAVGTNN
jgi:hypothetical protein